MLVGTHSGAVIGETPDANRWMLPTSWTRWEITSLAKERGRPNGPEKMQGMRKRSQHES